MFTKYPKYEKQPWEDRFEEVALLPSAYVPLFASSVSKLPPVASKWDTAQCVLSQLEQVKEHVEKRKDETLTAMAGKEGVDFAQLEGYRCAFSEVIRALDIMIFDIKHYDKKDK